MSKWIKIDNYILPIQKIHQIIVIENNTKNKLNISYCINPLPFYSANIETINYLDANVIYNRKYEFERELNSNENLNFISDILDSSSKDMLVSGFGVMCFNYTCITESIDNSSFDILLRHLFDQVGNQFIMGYNQEITLGKTCCLLNRDFICGFKIEKSNRYKLFVFMEMQQEMCIGEFETESEVYDKIRGMDLTGIPIENSASVTPKVLKNKFNYIETS